MFLKICKNMTKNSLNLSKCINIKEDNQYNKKINE